LSLWQSGETERCQLVPKLVPREERCEGSQSRESEEGGGGGRSGIGEVEDGKKKGRKEESVIPGVREGGGGKTRRSFVPLVGVGGLGKIAGVRPLERVSDAQESI
jgi:hypothetical protein